MTFTSRPASGTDYPDTKTAVSLQKAQACRLLPALVGRLGLEIYDRDWVPELPYTLWESVAGAGVGPKEFRVEEVALFRLLAQVAGGWVRHDVDGGLMFVSRGQWLREHAAWKRSGRARIRRVIQQGG